MARMMRTLLGSSVRFRHTLGWVLVGLVVEDEALRVGSIDVDKFVEVKKDPTEFFDGPRVEEF